MQMDRLTGHLDVAVHGKVVSELRVAVVIRRDEEAGAKLAVAVGHTANHVHEVRGLVELLKRVVYTGMKKILRQTTLQKGHGQEIGWDLPPMNSLPTTTVSMPSSGQADVLKPMDPGSTNWMLSFAASLPTYSSM